MGNRAITAQIEPQDLSLVERVGTDSTIRPKAPSSAIDEDYQRLVYLGRISAGAFHNIIGPLNHLSLEIQEAGRDLSRFIGKNPEESSDETDEFLGYVRSCVNIVNMIERQRSEILDSAKGDDQTDVTQKRLASLGRKSSEAFQDLDVPLDKLTSNVHLAGSVLDRLDGNVSDKLQDVVTELQRYIAGCSIALENIEIPRNDFLELANGDAEATLGNIRNPIDRALSYVDIRTIDVTIKTEYSSEVPEIPMYQNGLMQVVGNLVKNSAEAVGDKGGEITITTDVHEGYARVRMKDNGIGIAPEHLVDMFSGKSTKENGHGLGTQYCESVVKMHGGKIFYESELGKGTTVSVMLPLYGATDLEN